MQLLDTVRDACILATVVILVLALFHVVSI